MPEIINGPVDLEEISESARKRITRAQRHGAATSCVPVDVEIRGGSYIPVTDRDNPRPWNTIGEFRFSLFVDKGRGGVAAEVVRYNLTGDGRMRRLKAVEVGVDISEIKFDQDGHRVPNIEWFEDVVVRGVDAQVSYVINPQTGQAETTLSFIAVPEPGQWRGVEGFGGKFPSADRPRTVINSMDNPIPFLQSVGVVF